MRFIFHGHPGFTQGRRQQQQQQNNNKRSRRSGSPPPLPRTASSSHSVASDSTLPSNEEDDEDEDRQQQQRYRVVRFDESQNVSYASHSPTEDEIREQWYTRENIRSFKRDTAIQAQLFLEGEQSVLLKREPHNNNKVEEAGSAPTPAATATTTTSQILWQHYKGFCNVQTSADILALLSSSKVSSLHYSLVGLDHWIVKPMCQDVTERRRRILRQVQYIQNTYRHDDTELRASKIAQISKTISQPSRLYAYHVARIAAAAGTTTTPGGNS